MFPQKIFVKDRAAGSLKRLYHSVLRFMYRWTLHPGKQHAVYTYDAVTANSAFTQEHITRFWDTPSSILYPICDDMLIKPNPPAKQKYILSVGRFFENTPSNHHKRHDVLVKAFAQMTDLHKDGWQLHLAGSVAEDGGTLRYILELMKAAQGLPVYFHFNCSFGEIKTLFNQARVYWHATGFGSDARKFPERQEHFGIVTVEAMSTGAIPVVINAAGQKETVVDGRNGYLWKTPAELEAKTRHVVHLSSSQLNGLSDAARERSKDFGKTAFRKQVKDIFGPLL